MDAEGVILKGEYLLEVAKLAGLFNRVFKAFYLGINGLASWEGSLRDRVKVLAGLDEDLFLEAARRLKVRRGFSKLTRDLRRVGWRIAVITGGFDLLEGILRKKGVEFDWYFSNKLLFDGGKLKGVEVRYKSKGEVARRLKSICDPDLTVAVGDGWNDIEMFEEADLAVGFRPKCVIRPFIDVEVRRARGLWRLLRLL